MKNSLVGLIGLALLSFLLISCGKPAPTFQEAVKDPSLRQNYVQEILKKHPAPPPLKKLLYATPEVLEELERTHEFTPQKDALMGTNPLEEISVPLVGTRDLPMRTTVFSAAFEASYVQNERDFVSSLLHEYDHVWQLNNTNIAGFAYAGDFQIVAGEHKGKQNLELLNIVMELDAFRKEISRVASAGWGSSLTYANSRYGLYAETYAILLKSLAENPPIDSQIKKRMEIEFFASWFEKTPIFSLTPDGKPRLTNPNTGESYILPEEVFLKKESR